MATGFRAAGATTSGASQVASLGLALAGSLQAGDVVYLMVNSSSSSATQRTYSVSGGGVATWTAAGTQPARTGSGSNSYLSAQLYAGTVTTGGGGTVTGTIAGGGSEYMGMAYEALDGTAAAPTDAYPAPLTYGATKVSSFATPSGTTGSSAGDWYLTFFACNFSTAGAGTFTAPSGCTTQGSANGSDGQAVAVADTETALGASAGFGGGSWGYSHASIGITFSVAVSTAGVTLAGAAALSGSGTLGGTGVFAGAAGLSGTGTLTGTGTSAGFGGGAALSGLGVLGGTGTGTWTGTAALDGEGTLSGTWIGVLQITGTALSGAGTLNLSGVVLRYPGALSGNGTLSVLQATGGLVFASPGAATPRAYPLSSQVMVAGPGTGGWVPLGSLGAVTALTYSFTCPGGCDAMTATVMVPAAYRTQLFNPGWQVRITRGGHQVWDGKLDEPVPTSSGWTLTASGTGNRGTDYLAVYTGTWPNGQPDDAINEAITRGMPWVNPGVGSPSGMWFGQQVDSAAQTITALLNLICTRGGLTWMVNSQPGGRPGDDLTVFPLPTVPNRLLTCTSPVPRTLGGDINTVYLRYEVSADTSSAAVYGLTSVANAASVAAHGVLETYIDLSDVGVMSQSAAQAVGNQVLAIYQRASFAGPFTGSYGQLCNTGGAPVDPGTDQAGTMVRLILTDFGYGGEVTPQFPVTFITGAYSWDDLAQRFSATPYVNLDQSLTGLLSTANTVLTPITVASA